MHTDTSEKQLETILVNYLRDVHQYEQGVSEDYIKDYALDTARVKRFLLLKGNSSPNSTSSWLSVASPMCYAKVSASFRSFSTCTIRCRPN